MKATVRSLRIENEKLSNVIIKQSSNDAKLKLTIHDCKEDMGHLKKEIDSLQEKIVSLNNEIIEKENQIANIGDEDVRVIMTSLQRSHFNLKT